ncbi:natural killer cells antigen CD94-like isoform X2 [Tupaia chinensis]|nr:natural killer cells antigen CD94-like isoform X2 [Tupaia chinensis]
MSGTNITYSNCLFKHSSEPQRRQDQNSFSHLDPPAPCFLSKFVAIILWIICLVLLVSVGVLATMLHMKSFQVESHPGNFSSDNETNKTDQNHPVFPVCPNSWHQYGSNCYYFSRNKQSWEECHHFCIGLNSIFLKLNTEEEQSFVIKLSKMQCALLKEKFWIDVYNSQQPKLLDGTALTSGKLQLPGHEKTNNKCMHIKSGQIIPEDCQDKGYCICKKTIYSY